jgi:PKD repeat protein
MNYLNNGITNGYAWYEVAGGRQDYMNYFQQCREVTIEISDTKLLPANQLINHWNYNYRSFLNYMEQANYGVRGIVTDTITGEPIYAQVFINSHDVDSTMVFSSLPVGDYHRPIKAGTYNITYFADGYSPKTRKNVVVNDYSITFINVQLWNGNPIPQFTSSDTLIAPGHTIQFFDNSAGSPNSRLWTFEGGTPANSTDINPIITYNQVGDYNVTLNVTNIIGNSTLVKEDYISVQEGVGVNNLTVGELKVFPNPSKDGIFTISSAVEMRGFEVCDLTGKLLMHGKLTGKRNDLNLKGFTPGIYLLKLYDNSNGFSVDKLVIQ